MSDDKREIFITCTSCNSKITLEAPVRFNVTPAAWPVDAEGNYPMACTFDEYLGRVSALVKAAQAAADMDEHELPELDVLRALKAALKLFTREA